jgi:hypothetical protein
VLTVPFRLPGLNEIIDARGVRLTGAGGRVLGDKYRQLKKRLEGQLGLLIRAQGLRPMEGACFTYLLREPNRKRDPSNVLAGAMKVIEDALQRHGILQNDGWGQVYGIGAFWEVSEHAGVVVVLSPTRLYTRTEVEEIRHGQADRHEPGARRPEEGAGAARAAVIARRPAPRGGVRAARGE